MFTNPFDGLAVALALAAVVLRYLDRNHAGNVAGGLSLLASMLGQLFAHRRAARSRAEARPVGR